MINQNHPRTDTDVRISIRSRCYNKNIKTVFIIVIQFRNLSRSMEYVKNREIQLLEMRTTISDMKNMGTADETLQKEVLVSLKT